MTPALETERRKRIRLAVAAYAYEIEDAPLLTDAAFDVLARAIDPAISTGHDELDQFFRETFQPHTGQWIHAHPDLIGVKRAWRRWNDALGAQELCAREQLAASNPVDSAILRRIEQGDRPTLLSIADAAGLAPDKAMGRLLDMTARGLVAPDDSQPRRWGLMAPGKRQISASPKPEPPKPAPVAPRSPSPPKPAPVAARSPTPPAAVQMSLF